ncbi:MAG: twin-arginine translocase TatA/TatE family subunit [Alphaproteobacteria bacterium]|jgi:sec-independent protein translocase protein TatA|nr:twin-arginine translocase TatA/TatE family subunit [Alphaproteobacteria bacterium]
MGLWKILLILVIILIIFGAGKLPKVMGDLGRGVRSFKKGLEEGDDPKPKKKKAPLKKKPRKKS